jgi:general secretion pathway protein A
LSSRESNRMYKTFFALKENPFNVNPDPRYLFLTRNTQEALAVLTYGIETRKGFVLLTGEVGTGKTTLLNTLLEGLHSQHDVVTAFIFNPRLSVREFFNFMMTDFGIECQSQMKSEILIKLNRWLLQRYELGERVVLIVDEAQRLSPQMLEEIRLLTNLETSTDKLLQIVLAGQPELEHQLNQPELRQLRQRITLRAKTLPLTIEETHSYVLERLRIAGGDGSEVFSSEAIEALHFHAKGIPRMINQLGEHALISGFADNQKPITADIIEAVADDFGLNEIETLTLTQRLQIDPTHEGRGDLSNSLMEALNATLKRLKEIEDRRDGQPLKAFKPSR